MTSTNSPTTPATPAIAAKQSKLGHSDIQIASIGLGCMGMSEFYGDSDDDTSLTVLRHAHQIGVSMFDTADTYGAGHNEELLARALGDRQRYGGHIIATKFGICRKPGEYERRIDNSPAYIRRACEDSLRRLGVETIDLYYAHRIDPEVPIEETVGAMAELVHEGKVRTLGLSEISGVTLRRAHAVHPISAVQTEYSLWNRDPELELLPVCRELAVSLVAYSPLGRGFLSGKIDANTKFAANDLRGIFPRFQGEHLTANLDLMTALHVMAKAKHCTPSQIALAWLLAQGEDIIPIPGTRHIHYLEQNMAAMTLTLSAADLATLEQALPVGVASGARYPQAGMKGVPEHSK
jgi:aryl-alcohol dehydrogenase-like predicted oxidoreductase